MKIENLSLIQLEQCLLVTICLQGLFGNQTFKSTQPRFVGERHLSGCFSEINYKHINFPPTSLMQTKIVCLIIYLSPLSFGKSCVMIINGRSLMI